MVHPFIVCSDPHAEDVEYLAKQYIQDAPLNRDLRVLLIGRTREQICRILEELTVKLKTISDQEHLVTSLRDLCESTTASVNDPARGNPSSAEGDVGGLSNFRREIVKAIEVPVQHKPLILRPRENNAKFHRQFLKHRQKITQGNFNLRVFLKAWKLHEVTISPRDSKTRVKITR